MACQTQYLLKGHYKVVSPVALFLFFGTLFIYSAHRLYGLHVSSIPRNSPYSKFSFLLKINMGISAIVCAICWLQFSEATRWHILVPSVLSLAYILPILPGQRRLREVAMLKIFLLSVCWSWLTVIVPGVAENMGWSAIMPAMALERGAFIFAIGIGFDLRDRQRDLDAGLATLPVKLGERSAILCAAFSLLVAWGIAFLFAYANIYPVAAFYSTSLSGLIALILIARSGRDSLSPYYFLCGLDGLLILQFLLVLL